MDEMLLNHLVLIAAVCMLVVVGDDVHDVPKRSAKKKDDYSAYQKHYSSYKNYLKKYNKNAYSEKVPIGERLKQFALSKKRVAEHNRRYEQGQVKYKMALNHLSDLTEKELLRLTGALPPNITASQSHYKEKKPKDLPASINYTELGAVTRVKDQGQCEICFLFGAIGALESCYFLATGKLVEFSEQQVLDCSEVNKCKGGGDYPFKVYDFLMKSGGPVAETDYPYENQDDTCRLNKNKHVAKLAGYLIMPRYKVNALKTALVEGGPLVVTLYMNLLQFYGYSSGIYHDEHPLSDRITHAVLLTGYGKENNEEYWIIKNSWREDWGEKGYARIAMYDQEPVIGVDSLQPYF